MSSLCWRTRRGLHPGARTGDPHVQFEDGRAVVDAGTAAALATLPAGLGVTVPAAGDPDEGQGDPGGEGDG